MSLPEIITGQSPEGPWYAYVKAAGPEQAVGSGETELEAVEDLHDKLKRERAA